jgi:hypothetical protein
MKLDMDRCKDLLLAAALTINGAGLSSTERMILLYPMPTLHREGSGEGSAKTLLV